MEGYIALTVLSVQAKGCRGQRHSFYSYGEEVNCEVNASGIYKKIHYIRDECIL